MIEVRGLSKEYGATRAVDDLSFDVPPGVVTGFLGPNGSGKSTTMRLMLDLDRASHGHVRVDGGRYRDLARPLRTVGALLEATSIHPGRTARKHLLVLARSNRIPRSRVDEVLAVVGLESVADRRAGTYSLGMSQRLGIAAALLGDPPILLFDEPVNGLDPEGIVWVRTLLRGFAAEGRTVLVSSHLMAEMALTADRLVVIGRGRLIAETTVTGFIRETTAEWVVVRCPDPDALARAIGADGTVTPDPAGTLVVRGLDSAEIGRRALAAGIPLVELTPQLPSLEDAFMQRTAAAVDYSADTRPPAGSGATPSTAPPPADPAPLPPPPAAPAPECPPAGPAPGLAAATGAEWTKFRSLRSSVLSLLATWLVCTGFGAIAAVGTVNRWNDWSPVRRALFDPAALGVGGVFFGQLVLGALGVLAVTGEYSTGTIRATLSATPRRLRVMTAKTLVFGAVAIVVSAVTVLSSFLVTQAVLGTIGIGTSLSASGSVRVVVAGACLFLVTVGLMGLGLGAALRHTAGAISALFTILLVLPLLTRFLDDDWRAAVEPYLPLTCAINLSSTLPVPGLGPAASAVLMVGYAVIALVGGAVVLVVRDA